MTPSPDPRETDARVFCEACGTSVLPQNWSNHLAGATHKRRRWPRPADFDRMSRVEFETYLDRVGLDSQISAARAEPGCPMTPSPDPRETPERQEDRLRAALVDVAHDPRGCNGPHVELEEGVRAVVAALEVSESPDVGLDADLLAIAYANAEAVVRSRKSWDEPFWVIFAREYAALAPATEGAET